MAAYKLERATNPTWRDPIATFQIKRHGDPAGQIQSWRVDLVHGIAECVVERPLRSQRSRPEEEVGALAAELVLLIRAGQDDERLRWSERRQAVKVLADSALGGATPRDATLLRKAISEQLGDGWRRERGLFVKAKPDHPRD
jgi:hypothetical protein